MPRARHLPPDLVLRLETAADADAVEALYAVAFGPGRHARTAYRLREGGGHDAATSFVADRGGRVIGAIRQTRVTVGGAPAFLLGPLAVAETAAKQGIGGALLALCVAASRDSRAQAIVLVGDLPFYGPHGFAPAADAVRMPAPVERHRLLALPLRGTVTGILKVEPWPAPPCP